MIYYFYFFNLALFIGSMIAIIYGFCYLILKEDDITEGEFAINLILIIQIFFLLFICAYNLWDMKK